MPRKKQEGRGPNPGADYGAWLTTVPQEQRERVAQLVRDNPVEDYKSFSKLCQLILAELFAGNLTPEVSREARYWAELMFTAHATENSAAGTPEAATQNVLVALTQSLNASTLQPTFQTSERVVLEASNDE